MTDQLKDRERGRENEVINLEAFCEWDEKAQGSVSTVAYTCPFN